MEYRVNPDGLAWCQADGVPRLAYLAGDDRTHPPVVLLHSLGTSAESWRPVESLLRGTLRLIAPDLRGHGRSDLTPQVTVNMLVDDVERIMEDAGVERAIVTGVSLGGIVALAFAARHHSRVTGVMAADTFAHLPAQTAAARIADLVAQSAHSPMAEVARRYVADTFGTPPSETAELVFGATSMNADRFQAAVRGCFEADVTADLPLVRCPVLAAIGDRDQKTPQALSEAIVESVPQAVLRVVPDAGHLSHLDNPSAFAAALAEFSGGLPW
jgi:3-oxoadipate enol-lactonase